jgi:site-specific DNA-methyltransferase (adenine-specific)
VVVIELLNMDCMDYLRDCPDKSFDLAIVDPPYGIEIASTKSIGGVRKGRNKKWANERVREFATSNWDSKIPEPIYFTELSRVAVNQIIFGGNYFTRHLEPTNSWVFWDKDPNAQSLTFSDGELAWSSFHRPLKRVVIPWLGFGSVNIGEIKTHPAQKPIRLYSWLLTNYAKPGQRILDTHLGSGSSAIAAHYFGCDFVGIELDPDYYAAAVKRFNAETSQIALELA